MTPSLVALLGYSLWTLALLGAIAVMRTGLTLSGARAANSFDPSGTDVSPLSGRLCRAHANCYEYFPVFGGLIAVAALSNSSHVTDPLALWALAARIGQSVVHLASTSPNAVTVRFGFFFAQLAIAAYWAVRLAGVAAA
jgi:uncharacterized MAPEG superfamily protein